MVCWTWLQQTFLTSVNLFIGCIGCTILNLINNYLFIGCTILNSINNYYNKHIQDLLHATIMNIC